MAGKDRWGSMFSKAKDWVDKKVEETTTSDKRKSDRLASEADGLEREVKQDAQMNAIRQAIPGLDRALDHQEERKQAEVVERDATRRAARVASLSDVSWVQFTGAVSGRVDGLAVRRDGWGDATEQIFLESVDPVALSGASFETVSFVVPRDLDVGRHDLADTSDPEGFELYVGTDESFFWCPDYGTGRVTRHADGSLGFEFPMENSGSQKVMVTGLVAAPATPG